MSTVVIGPRVTELDWQWPVTTSDDDAVLRILRGTLTALEERGWRKGSLVDDEGRMCLLGGLRFAAFGDPRMERGDGGYQVAISEIQTAIGPRRPWISRWNDRLWRRQSQVLRVVQKAIENREKRNAAIYG